MKKKGFTLIELLAVIIILGILLLIAIPGVTGYINNSRKNIYVDTAKELIKGTSKLLNSGDFDTLDEDVTYYMDSRCIANESGKEAQSPFGKFNPAYVLVVNEDDNYNYYFQSRDETEVGVKDITSMDSLEINKIVSDVKEEDIDTSVAVGKTTKTAIIDQDCNVGEARVASRRVSKDGESMITLTFDNQGGTGCEMQSQYYGEEWGRLCKPKKEGLKFVGWYTKPNKEGDKITKTTKAEKSITVYASWTDQYATFDTGSNVNSKMKQLSGQNNASSDTANSNILYINYSEEEPSNENKQINNIVSSSDSLLPIYMWFDSNDRIIYWWSIDDNPNLNSNSSNLFSKLNELIQINDFNMFNGEYVTNMKYMFYEDMKLLNIDFDEFYNDKVDDMSHVFYKCSKLSSLSFPNLDTKNVTTMNCLFYRCNGLLDLDISNFNTSKVTDFGFAFYACSKLNTLDLSEFNTSNVYSFDAMFYNCYYLEELDLSSFDTSNCSDFSFMFSSCSKLKSINIDNFNTSKARTFSAMFQSCGSLEELNVSNFDTSTTASFSFMFSGCIKLSSLDIEHFNISKATNIESMFQSLDKITTLNVSSFNTSKVTDMSSLFRNSYLLNYVDLSNFDTSLVTDMNAMFSKCYNLRNIDLSGFDTSKVKDMEYMFEYCNFYDNLVLTNFNTSNVTTMHAMFANSSFKTIDISSFETTKIRELFGMFWECKSLTTIYASDSFVVPSSLFSTTNDRFFYICTNLVGGNGTVWNVEYSSNYEYARIDRDGQPGLFTLKT